MLYVYHPAYGASSSRLNPDYPKELALKQVQFWDRVVIEIVPPKRGPRQSKMIGFCMNANFTRPACDRLCEISVGIETCRRAEQEFEAAQRERREHPAPPLPTDRSGAITPMSDGVVQRPRVTPQ